jgi:hypothetical protein
VRVAKYVQEIRGLTVGIGESVVGDLGVLVRPAGSCMESVDWNYAGKVQGCPVDKRSIIGLPIAVESHSDYRFRNKIHT